MKSKMVHIEIEDLQETGYATRSIVKSRKYNWFHYLAFVSAFVGLIILITYLFIKPADLHVSSQLPFTI